MKVFLFLSFGSLIITGIFFGCNPKLENSQNKIDSYDRSINDMANKHAKSIASELESLLMSDTNVYYKKSLDTLLHFEGIQDLFIARVNASFFNEMNREGDSWSALEKYIIDFNEASYPGFYLTLPEKPHITNRSHLQLIAEKVKIESNINASKFYFHLFKYVFRYNWMVGIEPKKG